jgi:tRNA(Arg) A34 adenosine deaminase TadA
MSEALDDELLVDRLLDTLELDIVPRTRDGVERGNKVFGAAILAKVDLELVVAATNRETENPLWHGEVSCLNEYWALPHADRPDPLDCVFLSTHEPCSMCLSAITWSGFDRFYYFFTYEDSRDAFSIPHDLRILEQVFACPDGQYVERRSHGSVGPMQSCRIVIKRGRAAGRYRCLDEASGSDFGPHVAFWQYGTICRARVMHLAKC